MRLLRVVACVVLACAAWPAAAPALSARGDSGRDAIAGTARADVLRGLGGNDRLAGRGGRDRLYGGAAGTACYGGNGRDVLRGGPDGDRLVGGAGADVLRGGTGDDAIRARDGRRDRISCGPGRDRATLDSHDVIVGRDRRQARREVRGGAAARQPDASLVAVGDIARCPSGNAAITAALVDGLPGTIAALGDTVYDKRHSGRVRELLRADLGSPQGAHAPGGRQPRVRHARAPAATSPTSARPPASPARASTPTRSAPGTWSR